jgi:hypothetical protein
MKKEECSDEFRTVFNYLQTVRRDEREEYAER